MYIELAKVQVGLPNNNLAGLVRTVRTYSQDFAQQWHTASEHSDPTVSRDRAQQA